MTGNAWMDRKLEEKEMAQDELVLKNAEINVFVKTPQGFKAHIKVTELDYRKIATVLENVGAALQNHNFAPDAGPSSNGGGSQQAAASNDNPACETCGGPTEFKNGKSKAGKAYAGYFCTKEKDHKPHWV